MGDGECLTGSGELPARAVAAGDRPVRTTEMSDGRFEVSNVDGSPVCPFYAEGCTVYAVRPGACRAFGCFRRPGEAFAGMDGMLARVKDSAGVRRVALRMMDEAERWTAGCG